MAILVQLPAELLEQIYHYLGSIDDVHHLARTCKVTYDVIERLPVYTGIMRSIIGNSRDHRFDIPLSKMLDLHCRTVQHCTKWRAPLRATRQTPDEDLHEFETRLVSTITDDCPHGSCTSCLPDTRVHEILARYQGIRILEDEWLARQLTDSDLLSADFSTDELSFRQRYLKVRQWDDDFREEGLAARFSAETQSYTRFNADQRSRFYNAVTSVWLLNEIRWVLTHFEHPAPSFVLQLRLLDSCKDWIGRQTAVPLLDDLDRHAVFKFLYHHLLPTHGRFLADRGPPTVPLAFPLRRDQDRVDGARFTQIFLMAGQTYFHPPDLIDLVVRSRTSRKRPYPKCSIPLSTAKYQHPRNAILFPPTTTDTTRLLRLAITQLNIIARATINQSEANPHTRLVGRPEHGMLLKLVDDSAAFFESRALLQAEGDLGRLSDVKHCWRKEWGETWWTVWWWANSEEKARAKMERWKAARQL
ncbi:hypothetical protein K458DRAFT_426689 [Lentithecium fluviatile CBS 122367]|uniref:F-box domain-containing protein n=1 Tax=Lentithecium fluviatile CBS 122367 TaxID=1168545 RepID=A0A6G1JMA1_9PLEO|nr:hypothetical protein K458DRAFT_426689 [Lentithecium fluviatile CBS 122367]